MGVIEMEETNLNIRTHLEDVAFELGVQVSVDDASHAFNDDQVHLIRNHSVGQ